jgi:hypothetical protein
LYISEEVELRLLNLSHRNELFCLVDTNREHLREWLPWVDANRSLTDTESFIKSAISQHESNKGPQYVRGQEEKRLTSQIQSTQKQLRVFQSADYRRYM